MSMEQIFDYQVQQSRVESKGFDLMVMGRPEGPGCYCAANNIIRKYTDALSESYHYVVIDNEAGMEHLSRRTTHKVNLLLIISDPTVKGIQTSKRIDLLVDELQLEIEKHVVIINRVTNGAPELEAVAKDAGLTVAGIIPQDPAISELDLQGKAVCVLPGDSTAVKALFSILDALTIP